MRRGEEVAPKLGDDAGNPKYVVTEPRVGYLMAVGDAPERDAEP